MRQLRGERALKLLRKSRHLIKSQIQCDESKQAHSLFKPAGGSSGSPQECPPSFGASGPSSSSPRPGISAPASSNPLEKEKTKQIKFFHRHQRLWSFTVTYSPHLPFSIRALIRAGVPTPMWVTPFCSSFTCSSICTDKRQTAEKTCHCAQFKCSLYSTIAITLICFAKSFIALAAPLKVVICLGMTHMEHN